MKKIVPPFLRTAYNYDTNAAGDESGLCCQDKSLAQQHFAEECDINTIVKRFAVTGQLPTNIRMPVNADFEGIFDFQTAMNTIRQATESFNAMPANVRARFHNNPAEFVDFCSDDNNREEAKRLGLVDAAILANALTTPPPGKAPETPPQPPQGGAKTGPQGDQ